MGLPASRRRCRRRTLGGGPAPLLARARGAGCRAARGALFRGSPPLRRSPLIGEARGAPHHWAAAPPRRRTTVLCLYAPGLPHRTSGPANTKSDPEVKKKRTKKEDEADSNGRESHERKVKPIEKKEVGRSHVGARPATLGGDRDFASVRSPVELVLGNIFHFPE